MHWRDDSEVWLAEQAVAERCRLREAEVDAECRQRLALKLRQQQELGGRESRDTAAQKR